MDNTSLQNLLKRLCKVMWEANVTDPLTYVTQIAYLLFLKMLEETDTEQSGNGGKKRCELFTKVNLDGEKVDFSKLRWSVLTSDPDNERMLRTLRDLLPRFALHPALSPGARAIFDDARIVIPDGATLRRAVDIISPIHLMSEDADVKGDLFETLSSDLGQQKRSAQFRTPRHLIRVIVEMVNPTIGRTVCDSACGTGGFLIAAYEHILLANTSTEFIREVTAPGGQIVKRGIGDKLTPSQWKFLQRGTLHGFDGEQTFVRMTAMNALLHGFDYSPIVRRDSIGGSEDCWDEVQFDFILENPPFSGAAQSPKRSLRVEKGEKYVLFLAAALRSLRPGGRAGIVLPNGILFGDTIAHLEVKRRLLAECDLQAVVNLPKGMFEPYTPNPTCFLVFEKTRRPTKSVWFYRVEGDGSSLKKARKFGPQYRNDFPNLLGMWPKRATEVGRAWRVPAERIVANGYDMTLASLGLVEPEKTEHAEPEEILESFSINRQRTFDTAKLLDQTIEEARQVFRVLADSTEILPLGKCGDVLGGGTPSKKNPNYWNGTIPWITAKEMKTFWLSDSSLKITERALKESSARIIPPRSVIFVVRGSILYRRVPVGVNRMKCTVNQDMKVIVPRHGLRADYLARVMLAKSQELLGMVGVAGNSAGKLETSRWKSLDIPVPSESAQAKVVALFEKVDKIIADLRRIQTDSDEALAAFTPALLAKAFKGEL